MAVEPLGLEVWAVVSASLGALVPIETEPPQAVQDPGDHLGRGPLHVGIFDAQDERAPVAARIEPVEQGCTGAAHVEIAGRRWGEAKTGPVVVHGVSGGPRLFHEPEFRPEAIETPCDLVACFAEALDP
jgi:hypothetical protein